MCTTINVYEESTEQYGVESKKNVEVDNKWEVDLVNGQRSTGDTKNMDVKIKFLR